jgi:acetylornithine deacetylase
LQGGSEVSIYAAHCLLQIERRTCPEETENQATTELQDIVDQLVTEDPTFKATVKAAFQRSPFEIHENAQIVKSLSSAMEHHSGEKPTHSGQTFWTDAAILSDAGIETVLIGPKGGGLHSEVEWVEVQSVLDLGQILAETAVRYCG